MASLLTVSLFGSAAAFNNAPALLRSSRRGDVSMKVEDLVGGINDPIFGGTPEGKIWDPLGLGADEAALYRRRVVEIKHGRICMVAFVGIHELTINKQDYTKTPGEIPTFLGFKPDDPDIFAEKQLKELKNGRLAMIAVLGELMAQQVSGYGTYEQLGLIIKDLPLPL